MIRPDPNGAQITDPPKSADVVVVGGGIAGLETLLALGELAPKAASVTLVSARPDFVYKPLTVEEPFSRNPAERHELAPLASERGAGFVLGALESVNPGERLIQLADGEQIHYDFLVICVGVSPRPAFRSAMTLQVNGEPNSIDALIEQAAADESKTLAIVIPPGASWALPAYELALMARRRTEELDRREIQIEIVTPEPAPLSLFGSAARDALADLLDARRIGVHLDAFAEESPDGGLILRPGGKPFRPGAILSLPLLAGPNLAGLPSDETGFIAVDDHSRVKGVDRVYAAGDGTNFPIKQGGIATQQADAAAEHIAHELGAVEVAEPFRPILRGQLLTGGESLHMRHELTGGHGEGQVSYDELWWPPQKVAGRYLANFFAHTPAQELDPPEGSVGVELELPQEWHEQPMALDPISPVRGGSDS